MVVTDPAITEAYRQDRAARPVAGQAAGGGPAAAHRRGADRPALGQRPPGRPWCRAGAGTGLSGGATALDGGIVLSTEKMRDITVDPVTRTAVCQPGLFNAEVKKAVAEYGLWYPPDPSSFEICSIGGNIATNAGGLCCVKYGVTTDYVLGLQVVLADGTAVRLGGPRLKDVAGLSLTKLFVGSEGTLGRRHRGDAASCCPRRTASSTVVASFASVRGGRRRGARGHRAASARRCWSSWTRWRSTPSRTSCKMGLDRDAAAMLVAGSDERGPAGGRGRRVHGRRVRRKRCDRSVFDRRSRRGRGVRRRPPVRDSRRWRPRARCCSKTSGCRCRALGDLVSGVARIAAERDLMISVIAHAGDGNTHPLIVYDPADAAMARARPDARSARSWTWPSASAARSPASTASAG